MFEEFVLILFLLPTKLQKSAKKRSLLMVLFLEKTALMVLFLEKTPLQSWHEDSMGTYLHTLKTCPIVRTGTR